MALRARRPLARLPPWLRPWTRQMTQGTGWVPRLRPGSATTIVWLGTGTRTKTAAPWSCVGVPPGPRVFSASATPNTPIYSTPQGPLARVRLAVAPSMLGHPSGLAVGMPSMPRASCPNSLIGALTPPVRDMGTTRLAGLGEAFLQHPAAPPHRLLSFSRWRLQLGAYSTPTLTQPGVVTILGVHSGVGRGNC